MNSIQAVPNYIKRIYYTIFNSIAFYPILISAVFLIVALFTTNLGLNKLELVSGLDLSFFTKIDAEIAQTIASAIIGGVFSLTVFSFSMVMVVLSQASSNFSPRLLPGLISDKKHQLILGFYTGTLMYAFILLINLGAMTGREKDLGFASLLAAILGICCVVLFVVFIHSISESIQIDNIIGQICVKTKKQLKTLVDNQEPIVDSSASLETIYSENSGYYRDFNSSISEEHLGEKNVQIEIIPYVDKYVWKGDALFQVTKGAGVDLKDELMGNFHLSNDKHDSREYLGGMHKMMEVAVKALSPGINDPGTAIDAIIKLGESMRMAFKVHAKVRVDQPNDTVELIQRNIEVKELIRIIVQPIQHYGQNDYSVLCVLVDSLNSIRDDNEITADAKKAVAYQLDLLRETIIATGHHKTNEEHFDTLFGNTSNIP